TFESFSASIAQRSLRVGTPALRPHLIRGFRLGPFPLVLHPELYERPLNEHESGSHSRLLLPAANHRAQAGHSLQILQLALNRSHELVLARVLAVGLLDDHLDVEVELVSLSRGVAIHL